MYNAVSAYKSACAKYNRRFNNELYKKATKQHREDEKYERANVLLDVAMAICGSPYHSGSDRGFEWSEEEFEFLALFVRV